MSRSDTDLGSVELPRRTRTWYGVPAQVRADPGGLCGAGLWGVMLPHPSVVNWFIRHGLPAEARLRLSYWHELGHLQALPMVAIATILTARSTLRHGWGYRVLVILGLNGLWEWLAETYVVLKVGHDYLRIYRRTPNLFLIPFWVSMSALSVMIFLCGRSSVLQEKE